MMTLLRIKVEACPVKKEWNLLEDDDCVEDKDRSLSQDVEYGVEKECM
jgi:hypothetical protein